jgi:Flavodoxin-like fold
VHGHFLMPLLHLCCCDLIVLMVSASPGAAMTRRIAIIHGHPDATRVHFGHHLMEAYARGAASTGHEARLIDVAKLEFPLLSSKQAWEAG